MDKEQKRLYTIEILVVMAIFFCIGGIILYNYFKPIELIGLPEVDEMLMRMNRESIFFLTFANTCISFTASLLFVSFSEVAITNFMPIIETNASLKEKVHYYKATASHSGSTAYPVYQLIFELPNGDKKTFPVDPILYSAYFEGNKGILKYKEHVYRKLVNFYIEDVE